MTIGEIAKKYNLNTSTLRYYESIGLIGPVKKLGNGVREFTSEDEERIEFVCCMRNAGMSIEALLKYLKLYKLGDSSIDERVEILNSEKKRIDDSISELMAVSKRLDEKISYTLNNKSCKK